LARAVVDRRSGDCSGASAVRDLQSCGHEHRAAAFEALPDPVGRLVRAQRGYAAVAPYADADEAQLAKRAFQAVRCLADIRAGRRPMPALEQVVALVNATTREFERLTEKIATRRAALQPSLLPVLEQHVDLETAVVTRVLGPNDCDVVAPDGRTRHVGWMPGLRPTPRSAPRAFRGDMGAALERVLRHRARASERLVASLSLSSSCMTRRGARPRGHQVRRRACSRRSRSPGRDADEPHDLETVLGSARFQ
jgi:hypothetical protein